MDRDERVLEQYSSRPVEQRDSKVRRTPWTDDIAAAAEPAGIAETPSSRRNLSPVGVPVAGTGPSRPTRHRRRTDGYNVP